MISEADIERAIDYLRDTAEPAAQARANRIYMESWVKVVLAQQMVRYADASLGAQERNARVSVEYGAALDALKVAVHEDEKHRFMRDAAEAKIEAWRSQEATRRAEAKAC